MERLMEEFKTDKRGRGSPILFRSFVVIALSWTILIALLLAWSLKQERDETTAIILNEARSFIKLIMTTRYWNSMHGGVYVLVTKEQKVHPFLDIAGNKLVTRDGRELILINPEYMTHEIAEIATKRRRRISYYELETDELKSCPRRMGSDGLEKFITKNR
jgi:hypothetical protein